MVDPWQVVLEAPVSAAQVLEEGIAALQAAHPPLRRATLHASPGGERLLLSLAFDDARAFTVQHRRVGELATVAAGSLVDLAHASDDQLEQVEGKRAAWPQRGTAGALDSVRVELRRLERPSVLRVRFESTDALLSAWARHVGEGALFVPTARDVPAERFTLLLSTPDAEYADNAALRVHREVKPGQPGLWLEVQPGPRLQALLEHTTRERKEPKPARASPKPLERFASDLEAHVDTLDELRQRLGNELSHGGFFVATDATPALRSRVRLLLTLPNGAVLPFPAEVVHQLSQPVRGVGLQLEIAPGALEPIERLLEADVRTPHVLVVEDEAIWRSTLQRVFDALGVRVTMARDGREGLVKLIDEYFDLDLVVLDLHMPELDGRGLIERVRRLGGEQAFKMFLFSAASRAELEPLDGPGQATEVFSKLEPLDRLASRLAVELGKSWPPASAA